MATKNRKAGSLWKRGNVWWGSWVDPDGKRVRQSLKTTDKAIAEIALGSKTKRTQMVRAGLATRDEFKRSEAEAVPLRRHLDEYLAFLRENGRAKSTVSAAKKSVGELIDGGAARIADLTPERISRDLAGYAEGGRRARGINHRRQSTAAFIAWLRRTGRTTIDPMKAVPTRDEERDRKRTRRALTDDEIARLLTVAEERGRWLWYALPIFNGLRKGEVANLRWGDLDLTGGTITIRGGKTKGAATIPLHDALRERLAAERPMLAPGATPKVFATRITVRTQRMDFLRAGIARMEPVFNAKGEPVMIGEGKRARQRKRYTTLDQDGREVDFHALRGTFATRVARSGATPQVAQRLMRHATIGMTMRAYTFLNLHDQAGAIGKLSVPGEAVAKATGTADATPAAAGGRGDCDKTVSQCAKTVSAALTQTERNQSRSVSTAARGEQAETLQNTEENDTSEHSLRFPSQPDSNGRGGIRTHGPPRVKRTL